MIVKDASGREIEISLYGHYEDDVYIDEAYYVDSDAEVSEETIEYIMDRYGAEIQEEWYMDRVSAAEALQDLFEDR